MIETVYHPTSEQSSITKRAPTKIYPLASTSTVKEMKGPGGSVAIQNVKAVTAKLDARNNMRHKPRRGHVKVNKNNELDLSNTQATINTRKETLLLDGCKEVSIKGSSKPV
jgi:hypothetical protein